MSTSLWPLVSRMNGSIRRSSFTMGPISSSKCNFCSAGRGGANKKRRRRGKVPLSPSKKDRIRTLDRKSEPKTVLEGISSINLTKVGDTMESRLVKAQEFVYSFWRGGDSQPRPQRATLQMDSTWWFWNLLLMATPGIMIGLYCEFKAKPEMHEMLAQMDDQQRARILGETLEKEEEVFGMGEQDVEQFQESVIDRLLTDNDDTDETLTLLALKQRLDTLESQLVRKDKQLDHLRRYQLERTQQSGVQNRIEDKMITEWKSQSKQSSKAGASVDGESSSLSERMKDAVVHGMRENLKAKKELVERYGEKCLEYGRSLLSGREGEPDGQSSSDETSASPQAAGTEINASSPHQQAVTDSVKEAALHVNRAADIVSSSVASSNNPDDLSRAAEQAAQAASEASQAAQAAASAASQGSPHPGFLLRQWNRLLGRKGRQQDGEGKPNE